jgi:hypothetical protein
MGPSGLTTLLLVRVWLCAAAAFAVVAQASSSSLDGWGHRRAVVHRAQVPDPIVPEPKPYIWLSPAEIRALPIAGEAGCDERCGAAWTELREAATVFPGRPNLDDLEDEAGHFVLAKAIVAVRLGDSEFTAALRDEVVVLLEQVIGSENGASALYVGRNLAVYVIAADIVDLPIIRPDFDEAVFKPWLRSLATKDFFDRTLRSCHEDRPNNWGTHCGASRIAAAAYLNDREEIAQAARVFQGWLGDRESHAGFVFEPTAFTWMSDPTCPASNRDCHPRPLNPRGATINGHNVDGVVVDDQRRSERFRFRWPPRYTIYVYGALGGAVVQAGILERFGFDAWHWGEDGLRRAVEWMFDDRDGKTKWDTCDDPNKRYILDLVDRAYGSDFIHRMSCVPEPSEPGRNIAWTSWTHQPPRVAVQTGP